ncbi:MAG: hypothetical protein AMJ92_00740 [candidate division Zixibacteria bacterium SM23_81]|nr:MAG: hypothetical protein AMJ92_00740 [candidate division Zixibacteria bacterium SM23_81]
MWILRWLFIAIVMILVLAFALQNLEQRTVVRFYTWESVELPLILFLFEAFVVGLIVWFLVAIFHDLQLRSEIRRIRKENKKLRSELTALRNLPLEEEENTQES